MSWEAPSRSEVMTGVGRYVSYLAELGKFSRKGATKIDLTFIVPGQEDGVVNGGGYRILFLKIPGFSDERRYEEDVLYHSCRSFADRLLRERGQADMIKFDLVLATSFAFGELISRTRHTGKVVYVSHRPEFLRERLAKEFKIELGDPRRLRMDEEMEYKAVRFSESTVTVSEACRKEISRRYGRNGIHVIPNGVDTSLFSRTGAQPNGSMTVFTYVGRNHPEKGVRLLLESARRIMSQDHERDFELRLITDDKAGLRQTVKKLGIQNHVRLMKWKKQRQLPKYYSGSTFTVMPSYWESFSYVVAESLSCGTPVIASTAGALPEIAGPDAGLFFKTGDVADLADKLLAACSMSRERFEEMGRNGRQRVQSSFSKDKFLENYMRFIEESVEN